MTELHTKVLLIGVGNTLRGDDGAGPRLAEALSRGLIAAGWTTRLLLSQQLVPELAVEIAAQGLVAVVICDARVPVPGEVGGLRLIPQAAPREGRLPLAFTHEITVGTLCYYALSLKEPGQMLAPCWLATVPAFDLGLGEGLSPATEAALSGAAVLARSLAEHLARD